MGTREKFNENNPLGLGVAAAILIIAVGIFSFQLRGADIGMPPAPKKRSSR